MIFFTTSMRPWPNQCQRELVHRSDPVQWRRDKKKLIATTQLIEKALPPGSFYEYLAMLRRAHPTMTFSYKLFCSVQFLAFWFATSVADLVCCFFRAAAFASGIYILPRFGSWILETFSSCALIQLMSSATFASDTNWWWESWQNAQWLDKCSWNSWLHIGIPGILPGHFRGAVPHQLLYSFAIPWMLPSMFGHEIIPYMQKNSIVSLLQSLQLLL